MAPTITATRPVKLDDLAEHPENDRISDVDRIARSLLVNNQYRPIVVREASGFVLAGNHVLQGTRLLASGTLPPMPEGYDDPEAEGYQPALAAAVERYDPAEYAEIVATLVDCTEDEARGIMAADNHTADDSTYNTAASLELARALESAGMLAAATWDLGHLDDMAASLEEAAAAAAKAAERAPGVGADKTMDGYAEGYEASGTRSVVIFLGAEEYTEITERLARLRKVYGVDSNTEVMVRLIRDADRGGGQEAG